MAVRRSGSLKRADHAVPRDRARAGNVIISSNNLYRHYYTIDERDRPRFRRFTTDKARAPLRAARGEIGNASGTITTSPKTAREEDRDASLKLTCVYVQAFFSSPPKTTRNVYEFRNALGDGACTRAVTWTGRSPDLSVILA